MILLIPDPKRNRYRRRFKCLRVEVPDTCSEAVEKLLPLYRQVAVLNGLVMDETELRSRLYTLVLGLGVEAANRNLLRDRRKLSGLEISDPGAQP